MNERGGKKQPQSRWKMTKTETKTFGIDEGGAHEDFVGLSARAEVTADGNEVNKIVLHYGAEDPIKLVGSRPIKLLIKLFDELGLINAVLSEYEKEAKEGRCLQ